MKFNDHLELVGRHAFLSPSKHHWLNYDDVYLAERYTTAMAAARGTALHEFASDAITLGIKLPNNNQTINRYVNDAIGFRMTPEQPLYYSDNCFGTADAIKFSKPRNRKKHMLRIHDLKTGVTKVSENQLFIYAAIFCLEYGFKPTEIDIECRIYQSDEVSIYIPEPETIIGIMTKIIEFDAILDNVREEGMS